MLRATSINKLFFSSVIFFLGLLFIEINFQSKWQLEAQVRYQQTASNAEKLLQSSLDAQQEQIALAALFLSKDSQIVNVLKSKDSRNLDFSKVFARGQKFGGLHNARIQIIDAEGISLYRSWTSKVGDRISEKRLDLQLFFQQPKIMHSLSIGKYNLTNKTIVPIYEGDILLGAFEVIGLLDSVIEDLHKAGIEFLALADRKFKAQMLDQNPARYVDNQFIINFPKYANIIEALKAKQVYKVAHQQDFYICEKPNWFVSFKPMQSIEGSPMAVFYLFQPLDKVNATILTTPKQAYMAWILGFLIFILAYWGRYFYKKSLDSSADQRHLQSQVKNSEQQVLQQAKFWQEVIDGVEDVTMVVHQKGKESLMNKTASDLMSIRHKNGTQCLQCLQNLQHGQVCFDNERCPVQQSYLQKEKITTVEEIVINREPRFYEFTATPVIAENGEVTEVVEVGHDITSYEKNKQKLHLQRQKLNEIAFYDSLTGLPNRRLFLEQLEKSIELAKRKHSKVALMFLDLDLFKQINDSHGHEVGDQVLIHCAQRLQSVLRKTDFVARLGGDEFTIIIEHFNNEEVLGDIVNTVLTAVSEPCSVGSQDFFITVSIGISLFPNDGHSIHDLLKNADTAMYQAKDSGRNSYAFYNQAMTRAAVERIQLEMQLRRAIENHEFTVFYQPQYEIQTQNISGFEALIRWQHPDKGLTYPDEFITVAEETGMIAKIGEVVMEEAMLTIRDWHLNNLTSGRMAINISSKQFANRELLQTLKALLHKTQCQPEWIELELTETAVMKNPTLGAELLQEIKAMGVTISIDDFGTGYSSLTQLRNMPIDKVKIDQSFIMQLPYDNEDIEITKTIIAMAQNLGLEMIAEGIENADQSEFLNNSGCLNAQGFLFSRPLPREEIETLIFKLNKNI